MKVQWFFVPNSLRFRVQNVGNYPPGGRELSGGIDSVPTTEGGHGAPPLRAGWPVLGEGSYTSSASISVEIVLDVCRWKGVQKVKGDYIDELITRTPPRGTGGDSGLIMYPIEEVNEW